MSTNCGVTVLASGTGDKILGCAAEAAGDEAHQLWLQGLRQEARRIAGECLDEKAAGLLKLAEDKMKELDDQQTEATQQLEADLRRCRQTTERMQQDKWEMVQMISVMKERLDSMEAAARAAGAVLPPCDDLGPLLDRLGVTGGPTDTVGRTLSAGVAHQPPPGLSGPAVGRTLSAPAGFAADGAAMGNWLQASPGLSTCFEPMSPKASVKKFCIPESPGATGSFGGSRRCSFDENDESGESDDKVMDYVIKVASGKFHPSNNPAPFASPTASTTRSPWASPNSQFSSAPFGMTSPSAFESFAGRTMPSPQRGGLTAAALAPPRSGGFGPGPSPPASPMRTLGMPGRSSRKHGTPMKSPLVPASPFVPCESGGCVFGFTLRLASGSKVGLSLNSTPNEDSLLVKAVSESGAIASWNNQCVSGPNAGKQVQAGDRIIGVNACRTSDDMLKECKEKQLLKFMVVRGQPECTIPWGFLGPTASPRQRRDSGSLMVPPMTGMPPPMPQMPARPPAPDQEIVEGMLSAMFNPGNTNVSASHSIANIFGGGEAPTVPPLPPGLDFSLDGMKAFC